MTRLVQLFEKLLYYHILNTVVLLFKVTGLSTLTPGIIWQRTDFARGYFCTF